MVPILIRLVGQVFITAVQGERVQVDGVTRDG